MQQSLTNFNPKNIMHPNSRGRYRQANNVQTQHNANAGQRVGVISNGQSKAETLKWLCCRAKQTSFDVLNIPHYHDRFVRMYNENYFADENKLYSMPIHIFPAMPPTSNIAKDAEQFVFGKYKNYDCAPQYLIDEKKRIDLLNEKKGKGNNKKRKNADTHSNAKRRKLSANSHYENINCNNINNMQQNNNNNITSNMPLNQQQNYNNMALNNNYNHNHNWNNNNVPTMIPVSREQVLLNELLEKAPHFENEFCCKDKQVLHIYCMQKNEFLYKTKREERELWLKIYQTELKSGSIFSFRGISKKKKQQKISKKKTKQSNDKYCNIVISLGQSKGFGINNCFMTQFELIWKAMPNQQKNAISNGITDIKNDGKFRVNPKNTIRLRRPRKKKVLNKCKKVRHSDLIKIIKKELSLELDEKNVDCCRLEKELIHVLVGHYTDATDKCTECDVEKHGTFDLSFYCNDCQLEYDDDDDEQTESDA